MGTDYQQARLRILGISPEEITDEMRMLHILNNNPHEIPINKNGCWYPGYLDSGWLFEARQAWMKRLVDVYPQYRTFADLGSGDGYMVYIAAQNGLFAIGLENDRTCFDASIKSGIMLRKKGLDELVDRTKFIFGDAFDPEIIDFRQIDIFHIYASVGGAEKALALYESRGHEKSILLAPYNKELASYSGKYYHTQKDFHGFLLIAKNPPERKLQILA